MIFELPFVGMLNVIDMGVLAGIVAKNAVTAFDALFKEASTKALVKKAISPHEGGI